jgi:hypothetical protein
MDHKGPQATNIIDLDKTEQTFPNINDFDSGLGEELSIMSSPEKSQPCLSIQSNTAEGLVQEVLPYLYLFEWPSGDSGEGTAEALTTLCKENWLNDRVISEVLVKLTSDADGVRFIDPCHLRRRFEQSDLSILPPLEGCRLLLAPFWVGNHWFLISADFSRSRMVCHDAHSRRDEIEYMQKVIRLEINHEIIWQLVESDKVGFCVVFNAVSYTEYRRPFPRMVITAVSISWPRRNSLLTKAFVLHTTLWSFAYTSLNCCLVPHYDV